VFGPTFVLSRMSSAIFRVSIDQISAAVGIDPYSKAVLNVPVLDAADVAEEITSRFLNVIFLFNGAIPIIALQLNAMAIGDKVMLNFTRVMDAVTLGVEEDTGADATPTDRLYWQSRGSALSMGFLGQLIALINSKINPGSLQLSIGF